MSIAQRYAGFLQRESHSAATPVKGEAIRQAAYKLLELDQENARPSAGQLLNRASRIASLPSTSFIGYSGFFAASIISSGQIRPQVRPFESILNPEGVVANQMSVRT